MAKRDEASVLSALWAAYGDALGFVTELTDARGVVQRTGGTQFVAKPLPWTRRIGGRMGPEAKLPAGCYSDDTELRLATSRAIRANGYFDVESFAKIELTIWPAYALGGGRGSKAAAVNLAKSDVNWFANFFNDKGRSYFQSGGNGAAMRVQPHVWAAKHLNNPDSYLPDVIRNAVCTHGHPRGIAGAAFHAGCVAYALARGIIPGFNEWREIADFILMIPGLIRNDQDLKTFWLPQYENRDGGKLDETFRRVHQEVISHLRLFKDTISSYKSRDLIYRNAVGGLDALTDSERGSGTKTAVLGAFLANLYQDAGPLEALPVAANLLSSDTDSIATMAGAIFGATGRWAFAETLRDSDYIKEEALRVWGISQGNDVSSFSYPDIFSWVPPRTFSDSVFRHRDGYWISGLGHATETSEIIGANGSDSIWQWLKADFGQTFLAKRRRTPEQHSEVTSNPRKAFSSSSKSELLPLFSPKAAERTPEHESVPIQRTLDQLTKEAISSNFRPEIIGRHILELCSGEQGIERVIAYSGIIAKAKMARDGRA